MSPQRFTPTRAAGLQQLSQFIPRAGRHYASTRNDDQGPGRSNVSCLSPWLRHRLVTEQEVVQAVLAEHSVTAAEKFIQEVLWRTYWKGWLELRPPLWQDYRAACIALSASLSGQQQQQLALAERGQTGIACFDAWRHELVTTGYLHNHARMWFASIWIFTLKLPWQLGADFFLRHLLDGDAASNTLSWRWVGGLQTVGKHYVARADNISRYTQGRFAPHGELAEHAEPLPPEPVYATQPLSAPIAPRPNTSAVLLVSEDDLHPESLAIDWSTIERVICVSATAQRSARPVAEPVKQFAVAALADAAQRIAEQFHKPVESLTAAQLSQHLSTDNVDSSESGKRAVKQLIMAQLPVGPSADALAAPLQTLRQQQWHIGEIRRDWDSQLWPHATHGYFRFKSVLPELLATLGVKS